jgi:hypothetical protein
MGTSLWRIRRTGNFSWGVERFYAGWEGQSIENTRFSSGEGLAVLRLWGRRAEDPFRGLRAGPVRYSPFTFDEVARKTLPFIINLPKKTKRIAPEGGGGVHKM